MIDIFDFSLLFFMRKVNMLKNNSPKEKDPIQRFQVLP